MCNCKKKSVSLNNLKNQEVLNIAKELYDTIITQKTFDEMNDFDWLELYQGWSMLYPHASTKPSKQGVLDDIRNSLQFLKKKNGRR
jgi:hypothetical protein